jgi:transposase-like protein
MVEGFRSRRLDSGPYTFLWIDALAQKVREGGRTVNVHALIATGVNADGKREILGIEVASSEDGAGWLAFLRGLVARGLSGVALVTSDCHIGLRDAIASVLPGAAWQRCRTYYHRNLLTRVPKSAQPWVSTLVRTIFEQPGAASVRVQHALVTATLEVKFPQAAVHLDEARDDILAFAAFPREVWRQIWSNNPQERLNKEIRRRTDVVGIFPGRDAGTPMGARTVRRTFQDVCERAGLGRDWAPRDLRHHLSRCSPMTAWLSRRLPGLSAMQVAMSPRLCTGRSFGRSCRRAPR